MITKAIETLYTMFDEINKKYYQGKIQKPIITIQTNSFRSPNILGWCSVDPVWVHKDADKKGINHYEINICAESLTCFLRYRNPKWGYGQAMFNAYCEFIPEITDRLRGTSKDCFHNDEKVVDFLNEVRQELKQIKL